MSVAKVSVTTRVVAKVIDILLIVTVAAAVLYPLGPIVGFLYSLLGDAMSFGPFRGQSIGKRLMKLRVVHATQRRPILIKESLLRNAPVGVVTFFAIIPVWGWFIVVLLGIPLLMMEVYLMLSVATGHRLGDVMGDTEVVEAAKA